MLSLQDSKFNSPINGIFQIWKETSFVHGPIGGPIVVTKE